ncbi:MAG: hypothetical protein HY875_15515 [Chloroflexi bacterium]|nr:hypothetical protein [Chloroflexota bacterium]
MLVFGGVRAFPDGLTNELWAYSPSGNQWTQQIPQGLAPPARANHSAVWDSESQRMLVFGGANGEASDVLGDLWAYDPKQKTWTKLDPPGVKPGPRQSHTAVWDADQQQMLVYGGWAFVPGTPNLSELWSYTPGSNSWQLMDPTGDEPDGRLRHAAAWDDLHHEMLVFGGLATKTGWSNEVHAYSTHDNAWISRAQPTVAPPNTNRVSAAWDPLHSQLLVFGGIGECFVKNDLWAYSTISREWKRRGLGPNSSRTYIREGGSAVFDESDGSFLLFGGCSGSSPTNEVVRLSTANGSFTTLQVDGVVPPPRVAHQAVWDPGGRDMYMFGGTGPGAGEDLWRFSTDTGTWQRLAFPGPGPFPPGRMEFAMAWDPATRRLFIFGGVGGPAGRWGDAWIYSADSDSWTKIVTAGPEPSARGYPAGAWDSSTHRFLVYGGWSQDERFAKILYKEIWAYDPTANHWTVIPQTSAQPSLRAKLDVVWDPVGGRLLLFGGEVVESNDLDTPHLLNELWEWRPQTNTWTELKPGGLLPSVRYLHSVGLDSNRQELWSFGGYGDGRFQTDLPVYSMANNRWRFVEPPQLRNRVVIPLVAR